MADNVAVTAGSGTLIATDDDGTAHHQYVKLEFGADNTQTKVTSTAGLPVTGDGTDLKITLDGEAVVLGAGSAAIGKLAANSGVDIGDVDILSLPSSLVLGTQADDVANTSDGLQTTAFGYWFDGTTWDRARGDSTDGLLVNLGSNNDVVVSQGTASNLNATVVGTGTFAVQASLSAAVPAGTNNIGDVDVLTIAAGDNNIGNVDIVTVPADPFGADADAASATGSISAKLRFIASTGIPITGTVTVGSHAVTNAGTFAVQVDGSALTALQLIDDAIYVDDADWTDSTSKHVLVGGLYQSTPQTITDGDVGPLSLTSDGAVRIHDGGNTITVDGTVTANLGATDNAVLDAIQVAVEIIDNAISGNEMQVDVVGALPAGTNAIGKLAANSGVDIGDVDILSIAAGTNTIGKVEHTTTGWGHGVKTIGTAGTDEAIVGSSTPAKWVIIQAQTDNTSSVAVGASGVDATVATGTGILLAPGDSVGPLPCDNLNEVYADSLVNGEGVRFTYGT